MAAANSYVVTLELDAASFAWLDGLRRTHFPPARNVLAAHLTLFHKLDDEGMAIVIRALADWRQGAIELTFAGVRSLGRGVAISVESPKLSELRRCLADALAGRLTPQTHFDISRNMEMNDAIARLSALAQEHRLAVFRLLVQAGPDGMSAGTIATNLGIAPNTLTFHCDRLRAANLITVQRQGRSMMYAACFDEMTSLLAYLTENCCGGRAEQFAPAPQRKSA